MVDNIKVKVEAGFAVVGQKIFYSLSHEEQLSFLEDIRGARREGQKNCHDYCFNDGSLLCDFCNTMTIHEVNELYFGVKKNDVACDVRLIV